MMKRNYMAAAREVWLEYARGVFDIFRIGAMVFEEISPEDDLGNLEADLHCIAADFWSVLSGIESHDLK